MNDEELSKWHRQQATFRNNDPLVQKDLKQFKFDMYFWQIIMLIIQTCILLLILG